MSRDEFEVSVFTGIRGLSSAFVPAVRGPRVQKKEAFFSVYSQCRKVRFEAAAA